MEGSELAVWWEALRWGPGVVTVHTDRAGRVVRVWLTEGPRPAQRKGGPARGAMETVKAYLDGSCERLDWPPCHLENLGDFARHVLSHLAAWVPYGRTATYGEVAAMAGRPKAARAVGRAMARNPCPILVPCHRVVGAKGLGGFGPGLSWKVALLELERSIASVNVTFGMPSDRARPR